MNWLILLLMLVLASPAHAIIVVGGTGEAPDPPPAESCETQSFDVQFTTSNTYSSVQTNEERGQSWQSGATGVLYSISLKREDITNDPTQITYRIGTSADVSSSYLVESTCTVPDDADYFECVIPEANRPSLTSGTTYYFIWRISSTFGVFHLSRDSAQGYASGTAYFSTTQDWIGNTSSNDLPFKTKMCDVGQSFSDDFSGDLSAWAITGTVQISSGTLAFMDNEYSLMLAIYNTQTDTVNQYVKVTMTTAFTYLGVILRYTDASSDYYAISADGGSNFYWASYTSAGVDEAVEGASTTLAGWENPESIGVTITGTGTNTVVKMWRNPTGDAPDAGGATWGSAAPGITWTSDPSNAADTGTHVGLGGSQSSGPTLMDDFFGGDIP